ncbi:MAG: heparinase II/III family protein [Phycisphaeraceae bacterium]|nr:heparinase II/III family protein [Phycisphaeraceae bacterium]
MLKNTAYFVGLLTLACVCVTATALGQTPDNVLAGLRREHPRLLAHQEDFDRIRELARSDPLVQKWIAAMKKQAEKMLEDPVTTYSKPDGKRLLSESRAVEARALTLGMMHRIDPDEKYLTRIWADMEAAAAFPDWNPSHFLDVGEMTFAFAIAYDWLYDEWTDEQRRVMREAIIRHGLEPGLACYKTGLWWVSSTSNWNQVCNGGMINGALAIADENPDLAAEIIRHAIASLPIAMANYAPDGGYEEGPGYWGYGTRFNVYALAALDLALGHDFELSQSPGYDQTAGFPIQLTGPTHRSFNFADAGEGSAISPPLLYFAKRFNQPAFARPAIDACKGGPFELLWYETDLLKQDAADTQLPLDAHYQRVGVLAMRSAWDDPDAMFVAAKGGENGKSHGHLDLGSFILDAAGQRWFIDLGADDYNIPGFFDGKPGGKRWTYYRCRTEGHNTLIIGPPVNEQQAVHCRADVKLDSQPQQAVARIDLSKVYTEAGDVQRTITLHRPDDARPMLEIQDRIVTGSPQPVWWFAHTRAQVELSEDGRTATLWQGDKTLRVELLQPTDSNVKFTVMDARPLPGSVDPVEQNPNNGAKIQNPAVPGGNMVRTGDTPVFGEPDPKYAIRKLTIALKDVSNTSIVVRITPTGE